MPGDGGLEVLAEPEHNHEPRGHDANEHAIVRVVQNVGEIEKHDRQCQRSRRVEMGEHEQASQRPADERADEAP